MRERWFGATGRRVPSSRSRARSTSTARSSSTTSRTTRRLREAHAQGTPVVVRAATPEAVKEALARPEVATVLVPTEELLDLDLTSLTYG